MRSQGSQRKTGIQFRRRSQNSFAIDTVVDNFFSEIFAASYRAAGSGRTRSSHCDFGNTHREVQEKINRAETALERRFYKVLNRLLVLQGIVVNR